MREAIAYGCLMHRYRDTAERRVFYKELMDDAIGDILSDHSLRVSIGGIREIKIGDDFVYLNVDTNRLVDNQTSDRMPAGMQAKIG
jgi:hypothetical protein